MLTNQYKLPSYSGIGRVVSLTLLCMYYIGNVAASNTAADNAQADDQTSDGIENYRDEPISPIPQTVTVDTVKAQLGKTLFSDKRLSKDNTISCASCHDPARAFTDGRATAVGLGDGRRNTPTLLGAAHAGSPRFGTRHSMTLQYGS